MRTPGRRAAGRLAPALVLGVGLALVLGLVAPAATPASAGTARPKWDTRVLAPVPRPGYPAYAFSHRNGRVYAGTYANPQGDDRRSRVLEWTRRGTLLRSWTVPGQDLARERGMQVANADARGRLVLLEKSRARVMTLDVRTGRFRTWATLPDLPTCASGASPCSPNADDAPAIPNYATWGPGGALYVTDYGQAVIWKIPRRTQRPRLWFASRALDGSQFGTAGIAFRPGRRDLLITQQSTTTAGPASGTSPTNGTLYRLPLRTGGRPGALHTLWTSRPGDLPDGFGIARSGHVYVACAGLSNQLVELRAGGAEVARFPEVPGGGENGSPVPFDTPSSATFLGSRLLVANQSFTGDRSHHAILDVAAGEPGRPPYLPRRAYWR